MATLAELQKRIKKRTGLRARLGSEEVLIDDDRGQMRPGDFIEQKLRAAQRSDGTLASTVLEAAVPSVPKYPR